MSKEILLYLVGGPMRTGKSQIARRFNALTGVSYVSTDDLFAMLRVAAPSLKIGWDSGNTWQENRRKLAPFVAGLARDRVRDASPLLIEGELLPDMVGSLLRESGGKARACFVGNSAIELEDKVRILEDWSASRGDWLSGKPHAELEWAARECIEPAPSTLQPPQSWASPTSTSRRIGMQQ